MKLKPEELENHGYLLLDKLLHDELSPFVISYLKKRTIISLVFIFCNVNIAASILFWFWQCQQNVDFNTSNAFTHFSYGLALAFALIPLHEYIHVLAYKSQGALQTSYDVNLKKFYFMALADKFVANKKEFSIVAMAPFVVITASLLLLLLYASALWTFTILGIMFTHTAFSAGDFGILNYFYHHREKDIVTYDDTQNKISYFYGKSR